MPKPANTRKKIKKTRRAFNRFQSDNFKRVPTAWRKPRGIDSRVRRRFRGTMDQPTIGYGTDKRTRHQLPNGFYKFVVRNVKELEVLLMQNKKYCAQIAACVSAKKRAEIVKRAKELDILVINAKARLRRVEAEA